MLKMKNFKKLAIKKNENLYFNGRLFGTEHYIFDTKRFVFKLKDAELTQLIEDKVPFTRGIDTHNQTGAKITFMPQMEEIYDKDIDATLLRSLSNTGFCYSDSIIAFTGKKDNESYLIFKDDINGDLYPISTDYQWAERFILFGQGTKSPMYLTSMGKVIGILMPFSDPNVYQKVFELGLGC